MGTVLSFGIEVQKAVVLRSLEELKDLELSIEPPVVVVYEKGFSFIDEVYRAFESFEIDRHLVDVIDPSLELRLSRKVFTLEDIVEARLVKAETSRWREAKRVLESEKLVSRRELY